jgi:hypothetical protein
MLVYLAKLESISFAQYMKRGAYLVRALVQYQARFRGSQASL